MRTIILIMFILLSTTVAADLEISLSSYSDETNTALIQIQNSGDQDLTNIISKVDNHKEKQVIGLLKPGKAAIIIEALSPGEHTITTSSAEGVTSTRTLNLGISESKIIEQEKTNIDLQKSLQQRKLDDLEKLKKLQQQVDKIETKKQQEITKKLVQETQQTQKESKSTILFIIALFVFGGIIYYLTRSPNKK